MKHEAQPHSGDTPEAKPWPLGVRLAILGLVMAMVLYAIIGLATGHSGATAGGIRVVVARLIAAVAVPLILLLGYLWAQRGKRSEPARQPGSPESLLRLTSVVQRELETPVEQRSSWASDDSLRSALASLGAARAALARGDRDEVAQLLADLGSRARSQWAPGSGLVEELSRHSG